jgi:UDP-N-acetylmuramate--alanine ligase
VGRRFELKGEAGGVTVVDDYGHHPVEIRATLATARTCYPDRRLVVVFQPHRFTRTRALFGDFCRCFEGVDELLLTEIYPASESPIPGVSGESLARGITQVSRTRVAFYPDFAAVEAALPGVLKPGDLLVTLGAGNVWQVGQHYLERAGDA